MIKPLSLLLALTMAGPAGAWTFSPAPICTLTTQTDQGQITITYDATLPEYQLVIALNAAPWPADRTFQMSFMSARPSMIATDRHILSDDGLTLTVVDRGFGNVLNGLEFGGQARANIGQRIILIPLEGIAEPLAAFRACPDDALS